ncbi:MAG: hypothetical protein MK085_03330 [Phycisphaerales bacterium]|nr:hypothetical protein [Phycisphaerales bacterium]
MAIRAIMLTIGTLSVGASLAVAPLAASATTPQDSGAAVGEDTKALLGQLNAPLNRIKDKNRSYLGLFDAYLDMTPSPMPVGPEFNQTTIWPGMADWSAVGDWAEANKAMTDALNAAQSKLLIGVPYGAGNVDDKYRNAGLVAEVRLDESGAGVVDLQYLVAMETIASWSVAEQYRLCEAGNYSQAFELGIATARVLRQLSDRQMLEEKTAGVRMLRDAMSVQRDIMMRYVDKIPSDVFREFATKELPFLKPTDNERLRRLELPEGDRLVTQMVLNGVFNEDGDPIPERMASVFGELQAKEMPLTQFGATKRWERLAAIHGSLAASQDKLTDVYDDWWRRWRLKQYDPIQYLSTEISRLNEIRYAVVVESIADMEALFEARNRLMVEINGTVLSAGLCGYYRKHGNWPRDREMAYVTFIPKRFDFDPYDKDYGRMLYRYLGTRKETIDSEMGRLYATGCLLYARGSNNEDYNAQDSIVTGSSGDVVIWPPLRELARQQELID